MAVRNALSRGRERVSDLLIPWCTYTDPEIAHVGLYVREAQERSIDIRTITIPMSDVDRARIDGSDIGFLKVHLAGTSDRILGATIVGTNASEVISEFTLAIEEGIGLVRLGRVSRVYPTYSAAVVQAAAAYRRVPKRGTLKKAVK
jgi:pyruvate/2-oxoglutarate dehydrogenase complex dihydrolipoamide dehydrogenase (E3) component